MLVAIEGRPVPVFPCYQSKRPACPNGFKDATSDPAGIAALWAGRSGLLVAVPTGDASGIAVLDLDRHWPGEANLPATRIHETRSGGLHYLFRHRPGLRCSQGVIAPGVDVRADGGYVIWWAADGFGVQDRPLADWPEWLVTVRGERPERTPQLPNTSPPRTETPGPDLPPPTTLEREVTYYRNSKKTARRWSREETFGLYSAERARERIAKTPIGLGLRRRTINGEAYALGRQVARGWLSGGYALLSLWLGAQECKYVRDHGDAQTLWAIPGGLLDGMQLPYPDLGSAEDARMT